ncbi:NFX1-type zinc finger-containing protein 1 isoform X3 [Cimex lectularius]|uniref:NF-X1-type domain-containing protein n=1 Tax=Cimex lectularius TaxID=79782 RepID=A0A8I6SJ21_CIMLE|nr:NFX1-type zinc finger-containing protein 1 isoform X3 [Cimex lectularius]
MIYELDLAKKEEKEKKEKKEEHDFLFEEEHDFLFEEEHDFLFEEEYDFFFNSTNLSDFFLNDDQSSRSDTQSLQRINFQSTDVPFFDNEDGIATIWEKPCFVNGSIDWHSILQLEEPMLIVLKLTDHLNDKESPSILIKDWHDLILLSDTLISVSKCKLNFHKESIILEMLSTEVLKVIIDLISEALTTIPSHEKLTVVNKLICFKEDVILYFDHLLEQLTEKQQNLDGKLNEIENILNSRKIGQNIVDVVGMTTTAGARLNILLDELKPRIVIIEEAAEIIESHCIASLNEHCQHVILFGDHKQLRPCIDCKEFATKYNFDLSLFERLINNGINPSVLNIQYRMRPEISALIAPAIYKYLQNDDSVTNQDDIKGVSKNVFFFDHLHHEHKGSKSSMYNDFEVHFALGLAHYFIMQGYEPCEITILTMYKEQANMLYEKQKNMLQKDHGKFKNLNDIIIATVDSYQGKENTIVIISLVRNNKNGHIGFLALENRVCVALSRARAGLFILGNMTILSKSSTLWQEVQTVLQKQNAIGKSLPLICQKKVHNTEAVSYNQLLVSSNTGCDHMCKQELKCGHVCKSNCHLPDTEHKEIYLCTEFCMATLECGHKCQFMCHMDDKEHEDKFICPLHNDNLLSRQFNSVTINPNKEQNIKNTSKRKLCGAKLSCGHQCLFQCQLFEGGKHQNYLTCKTICGKVLKCGHKCTYYCHKKLGKKANKHSCSTKCANKS